MDDFAGWLKKELEQRGWKPADLVRTSGIDSGLISRLLSRERRAGPETCLALAYALRLPPEEVFRRAGLLPPEPEDKVILRRLLHIASQLPDDDLDRLLAIANALLEQAEREKQHRPAPETR